MLLLIIYYTYWSWCLTNIMGCCTVKIYYNITNVKVYILFGNIACAPCVRLRFYIHLTICFHSFIDYYYCFFNNAHLFYVRKNTWGDLIFFKQCHIRYTCLIIDIICIFNFLIFTSHILHTFSISNIILYSNKINF